MRLISTILFSGVVAFGAAAAMAQDTTAQPPGQPQAGPPRAGPPGARQGAGGGPPGGGAARAPVEGGAVGTVDSVSTTGFVITLPSGHKVAVQTAASTTYRKGKGAASAGAITPGQTAMALGLVTSGVFGVDAPTIKASQVIVQPAGGRPAITSAAPAVPFQQGSLAPAKAVGLIPAASAGASAMATGTEADKASEGALVAYPEGIVNRVQKRSDGQYEIHLMDVNWPHHVFISQDFKFVGAN
jgi:hypothetical protein